MMRVSVVAVAFVALSLTVTAARAAEPIPYSFDRPIVPADLKGKTLRELELMRATIQARGGLAFLRWWLYDHFSRQRWYRAGPYEPQRLSKLDLQNLATLERHLASIPRRELEARWDALVEQHGHSRRAGYDRLAFSADGRTLATLANYLVKEPSVSLWDAVTGKRIAHVKWPLPFTRRGWHLTPTGKDFVNEKVWATNHALLLRERELIVVTAYYLLIGDPRAQAPAKMLLLGPDPNDGNARGGVSAACIAPDGGKVVAVETTQVVSYDAQRGTRISEHALPAGYYPDACAFVDSHRALIHSGPQGATPRGGSFVFDTNARAIEPLVVPDDGTAVALRGTTLAFWKETLTEFPRDLSLFDRASKKAPTRIALPKVLGRSLVELSPNGSRLLVADPAGGLTLWDTAGKYVVWRDKATLDYTDGAFLVPDDHMPPISPRLSNDAPVKLERYGSGYAPASALAFSPDGTRVAVAVSGSLEIWEVSTSRRLATFRGHEQWTDEHLIEAELLAERLGRSLEPRWRPGVQWLDPASHLFALDQPLPPNSLKPLSRQWLRHLKAAVCARRGCPLPTPLLRRIFEATDWYRPLSTYSPKLLTEVDRTNLARIAAQERRLGGPMTTDSEDMKTTEFRTLEGNFGYYPGPPAVKRAGFPPLR